MGCLNKLVKYTLFATNLLIFILGIVVLGLGIWVVVDQPSFFGILDDATDVCNGNPECEDGMESSISLYASASYILIVISALIVIVAFFGCCGAYKENKCMLGTYFTIILALFIAMVVGAVLGYSGNLEKNIKSPLLTALNKYDDTPGDNAAKIALKSVWNEVQEELKCCGVNNVTDWTQNPDKDQFHFTGLINKPEGCCRIGRNGETLSTTEMQACRESTEPSPGVKYYFEGCYTAIKNQVEDNQNILVGVAIGVVVLMFLNMLFAFALCTMVK